MIRPLLTATLLSLAFAIPAGAQDAKKDNEKKTEPARQVPGDARTVPSLPEDVLNFYGKVTGTVEAVDAEGSMKVKVSKAEADAAKNKAPKPESLVGMTIIVTPLAKKGEADKAVVDAAALAYVKGSKVGDPVTLDVRASSKGVVFRLLRVPTAAGAK